MATFDRGDIVLMRLAPVGGQKNTKRATLRIWSGSQPIEIITTNLTRILVLIGLCMTFGIANAQCYIKDYQTGKKVLERDDNYVKLYSSGKRVAEFDAGYLKDYQTGRKLLGKQTAKSSCE